MLTFLVVAVLAAGFFLTVRYNWTYLAYLAWRFSREPRAILDMHQAKTFAELLNIKGIFLQESELSPGYGTVFIEDPECCGGFLSDIVVVSVKAIPAEKIHIGHCGSYSLPRGFFYTLLFGADPKCGEAMHPNMPAWKIEAERLRLFGKLLFCMIFKKPLRGYVETSGEGKILEGVFAFKLLQMAVVIVCDRETAMYIETQGKSKLIPVKILFS